MLLKIRSNVQPHASKINMIVRDNSANIIKAIDTSLSCFPHTLHLVVKDSIF